MKSTDIDNMEMEIGIHPSVVFHNEKYRLVWQPQYRAYPIHQTHVNSYNETFSCAVTRKDIPDFENLEWEFDLEKVLQYIDERVNSLEKRIAELVSWREKLCKNNSKEEEVKT